jgi:hypothetical protein
VQTPFGLLGYDCRWLKLERVKQGFVRGRFWIPVCKSRTNDLPNLATFNFNDSQSAILYGIKGPKGQMDDNSNPESQRLALLMNMLPIIQPHQMLSLSKYC